MEKKNRRKWKRIHEDSMVYQRTLVKMKKTFNFEITNKSYIFVVSSHNYKVEVLNIWWYGEDSSDIFSYESELLEDL